MNDFCNDEWTELCRRTQRCAEHHANCHPDQREQILGECEEFCHLDPPEWYPDLLQRTSEARDLAVQWMEELARAPP